ncbi:MAG TPA: hypothetical protein VEC19_03050 [Usitatibacter sp.]|nr:hypothetical protein [Usitatibacter sp.]
MIRPACIASALLAASSLHAQTLADIRVSDAKGGAQKSVFKPDTPKVFASAKVAGIAPGKPLRCDWIAVKVEGVAPNYKIDSWEGKGGPGQKDLTCSFSKPTAGWPVGDYRVGFFVDGKDAGKATFRVVK